MKAADNGGKIAITGATIIDGRGSDPIEHATVVIEDGRIQSVKARGSATRGAQIIEADGLTLMPGMIDAHVHMLHNGEPLAQLLMVPPSLRLYRAIPNLQKTLDGGVTTVRDAGGSPAGLRMAVEQKLFPGPRLRVAITILSQTGGHADLTVPAGCHLEVPFPDIPPSVVDGVEDMRQRVREILRQGADWIKICTTGGVMSYSDLPTSSQFTLDEITAAVDEGRARGNVEVMAHAQGTQGIKNAIRAGCKSIEHGIWLDDEAIAMMKANEVYLVPTLVAPQWVLRRAEAHPDSIPEMVLRKARQTIRDHRESIGRAIAAGVKIAMGTDSGVGPHGENAEELEMMVGCGMTPMQAIVASTQSAATLLHLGDEIGSIEPGKTADLLLVDGDPLKDIAVLRDHRHIVMVMQAGAIAKDLVKERVHA
jgi:imidazolonepropionase-like amidohydrolase